MKAVEDERPPTPPHPLRGHTGGDHPPTPRRGTPNLRVTHPVGLKTSHNILIVKERKEGKNEGKSKQENRSKPNKFNGL